MTSTNDEHAPFPTSTAHKTRTHEHGQPIAAGQTSTLTRTHEHGLHEHAGIRPYGGVPVRVVLGGIHA